jgi:lysophospholipase L1-like esterase
VAAGTAPYGFAMHLGNVDVLSPTTEDHPIASCAVAVRTVIIRPRTAAMGRSSASTAVPFHELRRTMSVIDRARRRRPRRTPVSLLLALSLVAATAVPAAAAPAPARVGPPSSMASMGDSITRGFHTQALLTDSVQNSWSTGTSTTVNSVYRRLGALTSAPIANANNALTGARMGDFARQAGNSVGAEFVTLGLGANDACTSTEAAMTPVATYEAQFRAGMEVFATRSRDTLVYVTSVPDIHRLWEVGRNSFGARFAWGLYSICQSMLANAGSTATADVARRARVRQRVQEYNAALERVCAEYLRCRYDGGAAFGIQFLLSDLSTIDYFHPNVAGQAKAAATLWGATFDFTDTTPPTTALVPDREPDGVDDWYRDDIGVELQVGDEDVRGTEFQYRLRGAENTGWRIYSGPFTVDDEGETDVAFRSIDVNGNVEAEQGAELRLDLTDPEVEVTCPADPVILGAETTATVVATDALSGFAEDPNGAFPIDTSLVGSHTHRVEVQDRAGNTASDTCSFEVVYAGGAVRQPINPDGSSIYRAGSTVPVKFSVTDVGGVVQPDVVATFSAERISTSVSGSELEATINVTPTAGDTFRWDPSASQYVFNWRTRGLPAGTYELSIELGEAAPRTVLVSLR